MKKIVRILINFSCLLLVILTVVGCRADINKELTDEIVYDMPNEYSKIMEVYQEMVEELLSGELEEKWDEGEKAPITFPNFELGERWEYMQIELISKSHYEDLNKQSFGYALYDLNNDGVQELIWMLEDYTILAIFTIIDGDAQLLDAYWSRYKSILLDTGEVYTYSNGGASIYEYALQVIDEDGKNLTYKKKFGRDTEVFYIIDENDRISINEPEFNKLVELYPDIIEDRKEYMKNMGVEFFPL